MFPFSLWQYSFSNPSRKERVLPYMAPEPNRIIRVSFGRQQVVHHRQIVFNRCVRVLYAARSAGRFADPFSDFFR